MFDLKMMKGTSGIDGSPFLVPNFKYFEHVLYGAH